jgi:Na+/proline symporter
MIGFIIILASLLPVTYYIYVGLRKDSRADSLDDFFIYNRKVNAKDFANTTVGYSLQMAALFLFADWGIRYGFGALWVPVFWGLGFFLLYFAIPKFDYFISQNWTLHGYLKSRFNSKALQWVAAIATIIGLWGTMMVEIDYATQIYQPFFPARLSLFLLGMAFLAFGFVYIALGGYKAEVNTERIQVPVAYSALLLIILVLVLNVYFRGHIQEFWILNGFLSLCFAFMIKAKISIVPGKPFTDKQIFIPIVGIAIQLILIVIAIFSHPANIDGSSITPILADPFGQFRAQGLISLISLFFANALWQFVDLSSWQRVSSVKLSDDAGPARYEPIRRGLWRVMVESPVSWLFGAIFGMTLKYSGFLGANEDPSVAVGNFVTALATHKASIAFLGSYSWLLYPVLVAAVVAIMLSTVHALICAVSFTSMNDLQPFRAKTLNKARAFTFLIVLMGGVLYYILRFVSDAGIATALYAFYASQLSLFPTVAASFYLKHVNKYAALASILSGIVTAFICAYWLVEKYPDLSFAPPLFALIASGLVYLIISLFGSKQSEIAQQ